MAGRGGSCEGNTTREATGVGEVLDEGIWKGEVVRMDYIVICIAVGGGEGDVI